MLRDPMPQQITVDELRRRQAAGEAILLLDVRQAWENETAALPGSVLIPLSELEERWTEVPPGAEGKLIVAYCHHGVRSLSAAAILEANGVAPVVSLAGGIDAWSCRIDPGVPRY
jgi:rhodanese-related sulfurtransferase